MMPSQRGINLTVLVEVRRMEPAAIFVEAEQHHALADVEKDANVITTSVQRVSIVRGSDETRLSQRKHGRH